MKTPSTNWLSAHLYYNEPWDEFLAQGLQPFLQTVSKTGIASNYFFIRYWEQGPHIRLRLQAEQAVIDEVLAPNLMEHFSNYFEAHPSARTEPEYPPEYPTDLYWLPNNSIQMRSYVPELERFGGNIGLALSEQQFKHSSDIVLYYLAEQVKQNEYAELLGVAIRLHLSFAFSLGMDRPAMIAFFNMIFENWLPRAIEVPINVENRDFVLQKMNETVGLFDDSFEQQRETLAVFHEELLKDLDRGFEFEADIFNKWVTENRRLGEQLKAAAEKGQLQARTETYIMTEELQKKYEDHEILLWNIWADYVHLTNNRLGILNQDEAYLAYLMKRSINQSK